jgi:hypothetical protein
MLIIIKAYKYYQIYIIMKTNPLYSQLLNTVKYVNNINCCNM